MSGRSAAGSSLLRTGYGLVLVLCATLWSSVALAYGEQAPIEIDLLSPRPGDAKLLSLDLVRVSEHRAWVPQAFLQYSDRPLALICKGSCPPRQYVSLVAHRTTANLSVALSLAERVQLAVSLPVTLYQKTDAVRMEPGTQESSGLSLPIPRAAGIGNARIHTKVAFLPPRSRLGLGADIELALPTGDGNSFLGTRLPVLDARLLAHIEHGGLTMAAHVGGHFGENNQVLDLPTGMALTYGLGMQVKLFGDGVTAAPFYLLAEAYGMAFTRFQPRTDFPTEFLIAAKSEPGRWSLLVGAGSTIVPGVGTPNIRCIAGLGYNPRRGR